jgi:hypothetical protein
MLVGFEAMKGRFLFHVDLLNISNKLGYFKLKSLLLGLDLPDLIRLVAGFIPHLEGLVFLVRNVLLESVA